MLMQNKSLDMIRTNNKSNVAKKDLSKFLDFKPYKPTKGEKYMSSGQISHFKNILHEWKKLLINEADKTVEHMKNDSTKLSDPNDAATQEEEFRLELRTRDRERKLIRKIEQALQRVDDGLYGFCEDTGDPIGIKRLEARPIATLCIEAQERHERLEKTRVD
jgi:DnaK suppressor protein